MSKILVVEDDPDTLSALCDILRSEHHVVDPVSCLADAKGLVSSFGHDLIVLDWELPDGTGLEMLRFCRSTGRNIPILMLTAKSDIVSKEAGFDAGADDYLTKPFLPRELTVRIRALLRRMSEKPAGELDVLKMQDITLDEKKHMAYKDGKPVSLLPKELLLLSFLMRHPDHVYHPDALLDRIWPSDSEVTAGAIRSTVKRLRKKLDPDGKVLDTVHGAGYILRSAPLNEE